MAKIQYGVKPDIFKITTPKEASNRWKQEPVLVASDAIKTAKFLRPSRDQLAQHPTTS